MVPKKDSRTLEASGPSTAQLQPRSLLSPLYMALCPFPHTSLPVIYVELRLHIIFTEEAEVSKGAWYLPTRFTSPDPRTAVLPKAHSRRRQTLSSIMTSSFDVTHLGVFTEPFIFSITGHMVEPPMT